MRLALALLILITPVAFAGNEVGNGGDVVICAGQNPSHQMLDLWEAVHLHGRKMAGASGEPLKILKTKIGTLKGIDPKLYHYMKKQAEKGLKDFRFETEIEPVEVDDSLHPLKGKECAIQQIAIRPSLPGTEKPAFVVHKPSWDKMDNLNKAALLGHEWLYVYFRRLGQKDSRLVRTYIGWWLSDGFSSVNKESYWKKIRAWKIPHYYEGSGA